MNESLCCKSGNLCIWIVNKIYCQNCARLYQKVWDKNCNINFVNHLGFTNKFSKIHMLPDPVPGEDEHYLQFENIYGTSTTEVHRPSSSKRSKKQKTLPFVACIQHARNVNLMFQCEECGMWRLIYSKKKIDITS